MTTDDESLLAELAALSQTKVFHADTFKRARGAMKAAGLQIATLRRLLRENGRHEDNCPSHGGRDCYCYREAFMKDGTLP